MKILLVQTAFLGDIVLSTPVIGALKRQYPDSELFVLTTKGGAELLKRDPRISKILTFDKRGKERGLLGLWRKARELRALAPDKTFSLHKSARSSLLLALAKLPERTGYEESSFSSLYHRCIKIPQGVHAVERALALVGGSVGQDGEMTLFPPKPSEISEGVVSIVHGARPYLLLVPGSVWATKRWHAQGYREVARHFLERGFDVVLGGAKDEEAISKKVGEGLAVKNLVGKTTLSELMALVEKARVLVCNDSMALHLGSALKVPSVAVFCATIPAFGFGPWRNKSIVVEHEALACRPCAPHGGKRCPLKHEKCMREIPAERVVAAVDSLLHDVSGR